VPAMVGRTPAITADVGEGMLDRVQCSATMIVGDYDVSTDAAVPTSPEYQIRLTVLDDNGVPSPSTQVQLWASESLVVTANGQSYTLGTDAGSAPSIPVDSSAVLAVSFAAASMSAPVISLAPDFFLPGAFLNVFPDQDNLNSLSQLTSDQVAQA